MEKRLRMQDARQIEGPLAHGLPNVPRLVVGTARLGNVWPGPLSGLGRRAAFAHLDALLELGCSAFDLAASYQIGGTERLVGAWIASRRHRDRLFLLTKAGHPYPVVRPNRLTRGALAADLEASLRRLGCERVELFLIHRDAPGAPLEPLVEALLAFERAGKIGAWGVSNWHHERIRALAEVARSAGLSPIAASSPHFSLADWRRPPWRGCVSIAGEANRAARAFYEETQLPVLAWSPLGSGFLSGGSGGGAVYGSPANLARRERARALAARRGCSAAQVALAYLLHQPFPTHAIVSASRPEKVRENLGAAAVELSAAELAWLESGAA
ncbi:MAG: aldo/keto reductase [Myxococcales bacterium]